MCVVCVCVIVCVINDIIIIITYYFHLYNACCVCRSRYNCL